VLAAGSGALPVLDAATRSACDTVAERLEREAADLAASMTDAVFREVPVYSSQPTPAMQETVLAHSLDHVHAVARTIRRWCLPSSDELAFVRARAALRAAQHMPLSALLHSYRIGHRTVWERMVAVVGDEHDAFDAMLALTTLTLNYTDVISAALADGYVESQQRQLLELDRDRRDLLEALLRGGLPQNADTLRLAASFDLVPTSEFVVAVVAGLTTEQPPTAEALLRACETVRRHLSVLVAQPFVVVRNHELIAIVALARGRPASVARVIRQTHAELSVRVERWAVGISTICAGLTEVGRGYEEARRALEVVPDCGGVVALLEMPVSAYLLERADATAVRMVPPAGRRLFESDSPADSILVDTLLEYARADMAVRIAAERLCVHPNTVTYRLEKIERILGRDPTRFSDLVEVLAWAELIGPRRAVFGETHKGISNAEQRRRA